MTKALRALAPLILILSVSRAAIPEAAHPDYGLAEVRMPALYKTMGLAFLKDGTMVLAVTDFVGGGEAPDADVNGKVYLIKGASTDSLPGLVKEISNTWRQLSGVVVVEDHVYVSDRDGFYEIPDLVAPPDLAANRRLIVKWPDENHWNKGPFWHQWVFTPLYRDGYFYGPYSGSINGGGWSNVDPTSALSGAFLKWNLGGNLEAFAGGLRSPNGANLDPATGEMFVTDNQGSWLPSSTFMRIRQGRFYGHRQNSPEVDTGGNIIATHAANFAEGLPYEPPVAWLPHGIVRSSPSQPILLRKGTFAGDWLIGDVNGMGLVRVSLDKVGDGYNGAVFWFSRGTNLSALNRMAEAPDGGIVIGTITRIGGNWPAGDKSPLYLLTAKPQATAFDIKSVRSLDDGLELEFTQPVNPDSVGPEHFNVKSSQYIRQKEYGIGKQGDENRTVTETEPSQDRKRVHLKIGALPTDRVVYIKVEGLFSSGGKTLWNDEAWFTLNATSARKWDKEAPTSRIASGGAAVPSLGARSLTVIDDALEVTVGCGVSAGGCGTGSGFSARLLDPTGRLLAEKTGSGSGRVRFSRPGNGPRVYLLQLRSARSGQGNISVTQRIVF
ncbi:MAG: hypothetical protein JWO30_3996 [Fibrobacteres bacterium]|nr:hypothetical protein [Fibrobacterota bacterium]